jgi:hypothetical protein
MKFEQFEIAAVGEVSSGFSMPLFFGSQTDPGTFEMMLDAMKLQDLVIAACSLWKRHPH